jgi:hypothetical protein
MEYCQGARTKTKQPRLTVPTGDCAFIVRNEGVCAKH